VTSANPQPDAVPGEVIVNVFGRTDVGRVRDHNEDAFLVADLTADNASLQPEVRTHLLGSHGSLFMVADGMGGARAGEIASRMVVDEFARLDLTPRRGEDALREVVTRANLRINEYAQTELEVAGMGATVAVALVEKDDEQIAFAHVRRQPCVPSAQRRITSTVSRPFAGSRARADGSTCPNSRRGTIRNAP